MHTLAPMNSLQVKILERFEQLAKQADKISMLGQHDSHYADPQPFYAWAASAQNLLHGVFGSSSPHYVRFDSELKTIDSNYVNERRFQACKGIFLGAKSDVDGGYLFNLVAEVSGEVFGDFVVAAKAALSEGHHTVASVLACAALEDALKRYAVANDVDVEQKTMEDVVNALKAKGLVSGAQKSLLSAMPKIRNFAMHADWAKLTPQDAGSVIGFVEQFLLSHFQ